MPVYLKWKCAEKSEAGKFFVRSGPGTILLEPHKVPGYVKARLG